MESPVRGFKKLTEQAFVWSFSNESTPPSFPSQAHATVLVGWILAFFAAAPSDPPFKYEGSTPPSKLLPSQPPPNK
jgi:hypothetical protein